MADFAEHYLAQHAEVKEPRSVKGDRDLLRLHVLPALDASQARSRDVADVTALHHTMRATPGAADPMSDSTRSACSRTLRVGWTRGVRVTALPVISGRECIRGLERAGYAVSHQKGSHVRLKCPGRAPVTVPLHAELDRGTLRSILRAAGITPDELRRLLA